MNGYDTSGEILSLAKNLLMECEGDIGKITLEKVTLKLLLNALIHQWHGVQENKRADYKKATVNNAG